MPALSPDQILVRFLGSQPYLPVFEAMKAFTEQRTAKTPDEIWLLEHEPVFTQGQAGRSEYLVAPGDIPVVQSDRGGQVTYHGPGQITGYTLLDLKRLGLGVRELVNLLENAIVETLAHWKIVATPRADAPGVYLEDGAKIAALGLRVRKGCSYHGLNFNVHMDLSPWQRINPCGLGVVVTQMSDLLEAPPSLDEVAKHLAGVLTRLLGYTGYQVGGMLQLRELLQLS